MDLRCPKCDGTDLKKVSLAYQEGLCRINASTRLSAAVVGDNGPELAVGRATTRASQQSPLSKALRPPVKWSYWKVGSRSAVALLCLSWLIFYVHSITTNSSIMLSFEFTFYALLSSAFFVFVFVLVWRHNHSTYQQRYAQWDRSFICRRCGAVTEQG
jgi:hypothetical protein